MRPVETIDDRIGEASSLIGLLLVLVTIFTSEQARALETERRREGGAMPGTRRRIITISLALVMVTLVALLVLTPLVWEAIRTWGAGSGDAVQIVFVLVWMLLVPL